jgi:hypothetical protein
MAVLTAAGVWSFGFGVAVNNLGDTYFSKDSIAFGFLAALWVLP